jgi:hypothetical protein
MAFAEGTLVLTKKGWKKIEDIGGTDKLLTRNFLGDAQFSQPFAVKKKSFDGEIIRGGSKTYQFRVTPDHQIVYTDKHRNIRKTTAEELNPGRSTYLKHRSRYSPDSYLPTQKLKVGDYIYEVDTLDWYKFVGYVLRRGSIEEGYKRMLLALDKQGVEKDLNLISGILNNLRIKWTFVEPNIITISQKFNVGKKLSLLLGSRIRKKMRIPNNMIYNTSIENGSALIETFIKTSRRDGKGVEKTVQFSTTNKNLIDSMEILGLLCGYTISWIVAKPAGTKVPKGVTKRDSYAVYVRKSNKEVSILEKNKVSYNGKVYEVDMFQDQLLIKDGECSPIWMKPK